MKILSGHVSPETAYVVDDYPYGFRLRCKIRYWLEYHPRHGFRLVSQTTDPKRIGNPWNKPKASTYVRFAACMYLDDDGHVTWSGLSQYSDAKEAIAWRDTFGAGLLEQHRGLLNKWIAAKTAYEANCTSGSPLSKGLAEAREAFLKT